MILQMKAEQHSNSNMSIPPHVLVLAFPFQGHINPALQFSRLLFSKGLRATLIICVETSELTQGQLGPGGVHFLSSPDDDEEPVLQEGGFGLLERFGRTVRKKLPGVASEMEKETGSPVACLIYDSLAPWALEITRELNIPGASFFTQPCCVDAICYSYQHGKIKAPITNQEDKFRVEGMAEMPLAVHDLPSYLHDDADENAPECLYLLALQRGGR